jgi:ribosomal peptide maturation radical SAM protein 1
MSKPIALLSMPTLSAHSPCYQLGLLKPTLERAGFEVQTFSFYVYFGSSVGWRLHEALAEVRSSLVGEWIWARAAFGDFAGDEAYLQACGDDLQHCCESAGCTFADLRQVRNVATEEFLDFCLGSVDWSRFGLVGFTVLFQQHLATLAFALRLKRRYPSLPIILGGGAFDDDLAQEILRNCLQVDYIHCGEADQTLPELARRLDAGRPLVGLPSVLWRDGGRIVYEGAAPGPPDLNSIPQPDYDEYFYAREESGCAGDPMAEEPTLPIETARGCCGAEDSHRAYCGLNHAAVGLRAKDSLQVLAMLEELAERYGFRTFQAIDRMLDPRRADEVFGALAEARADFRLHYEIRPGLRRKELARMRLGGLHSIRSSVESFSTRLLRRTRRGVTAMQNLELVKWGTYYGMVNVYDLLVGWSGETSEDYRLQAELIARILHFQPPLGVGRVRLERGSPMFTAPALHGIRVLRVEPAYRFLFPPERFDLHRVATLFRAEPPNGLPDEEYAPLLEAVHAWQRRWEEEPRPYLRYRKGWDAITLVDGRAFEVRSHRFAGLEARLYEACADAQRREALRERFPNDEGRVDAALAELLRLDLMVFLDGRYLSLALPENPYHGMAAPKLPPAPPAPGR